MAGVLKRPSDRVRTLATCSGRLVDSSMAAVGAPEYVVTDARRGQIAVVRRVPGLPWGDAPPWVPRSASCLVRHKFKVGVAMVLEQSGVASIWATPGSLIGTIYRSALFSVLDFRTCRCEPRRRCSCGSWDGSVRRYSRTDRAWRVVDEGGREVARVTPRWLAGSGEQLTGELSVTRCCPAVYVEEAEMTSAQDAGHGELSRAPARWDH